MNGKYYIHDGANAWFNMAFDEWLFDRLLEPTNFNIYLRLYTWDSGAVTYGYNQKFDRIVNPSFPLGDVSAIRRITGGRAIYHDPTEFTFTLAARLEILPEPYRPLSETNRLISETLVEIFNKFGVSAAWKRQTDGNFVKKSEDFAKACFESVAKFEISSGNLKLAGGAQRRIGNRFIHQGSLKLNGISECLAIGQKSLSTEELGRLLKDRIKLGEIEACLAEGFSRSLQTDFFRTELSPGELSEIQRQSEILKKNPHSRRPAD